MPAALMFGGGGLALVGAVVGTLGALPFFAHEGDVARVQDAQRQNDVEAATFVQAKLTSDRRDWESFGQLSVVAGAAAGGVGAAARVVGALWPSESP